MTNELWRIGVERIQRGFESLSGNVGGLLVEVSPEWYPFKSPPGLAKEREVHGRLLSEWWAYQGAPCACRGGITFPERVRDSMPDMSMDRPVQPFVDAEGNPIVNSSGEPIPLRPGLCRYAFVYGDLATADTFLGLAERAGAILSDVPIPAGQFEPWAIKSGNPIRRWLYALHEIAWKRYPGSGLIADRMAYDGQFSMKVSDVPHVRSGNWSFGKTDMPTTHIFSELPDLIGASVAAIDVLLSLARKPAAVAPSTPPNVAAREPVMTDADLGRQVVELIANRAGAEPRLAWLKFYLDSNPNASYHQIEKDGKKAGHHLPHSSMKALLAKKANKWIGHQPHKKAKGATVTDPGVLAASLTDENTRRRR